MTNKQETINWKGRLEMKSIKLKDMNIVGIGNNSWIK